MTQPYVFNPIAHIRTDFPTKFGVPRQAGLVPELEASVVFTQHYRNPDALRGIDGFSHLWLVWVFDRSVRDDWSPMVRPPRLGGETRMGVFATRSPFRPNPIGLSSVRLLGVETHPAHGPVLRVAGADLVDRTPILDVKPYVAADLHPDAVLGFTTENVDYRLDVDLPGELEGLVPADKRDALRGILAEDPRPAWQRGQQRAHGVEFAGLDVRFVVEGRRLTVVGVVPVA